VRPKSAWFHGDVLPSQMEMQEQTKIRAQMQVKTQLPALPLIPTVLNLLHPKPLPNAVVPELTLPAPAPPAAVKITGAPTWLLQMMSKSFLSDSTRFPVSRLGMTP
jgi:hypothetical protein